MVVNDFLCQKGVTPVEHDHKPSKVIQYGLVGLLGITAFNLAWNKWEPVLIDRYKQAEKYADTNHDKALSQEEVCNAYNKLGIRCDGKVHTLAELGFSNLSQYNKIREIEEEPSISFEK